MGTYCIVADERRRCSEMNNRRCFRAAASERVNMCHDVVSSTAFFRFGDVEIDVREIPFHFIELLIGDVQAQLLAKGEKRSHRKSTATLSRLPFDIWPTRTKAVANWRTSSDR